MCHNAACQRSGNMPNARTVGTCSCLARAVPSNDRASVPSLANVTSLSELSGGRVVLGMGAGGAWQHIARLG